MPVRDTNADPNSIVYEKKISIIIAEYINKILLVVGRRKKKSKNRGGEIKFVERENRYKKETIISQVSRMR